MRELSVKSFVLILNDRSRLFLTKNEAEAVKQHLRKGTEWLEIGDSMIHRTEIKRVIGGGKYKESEKIKRGDYKCSGCGQWIPKFKTCGRCNL